MGIENAIIGLRSIIGQDCDIRNTMIMGADFFQSEARTKKIVELGGQPIGNGKNTVLRSAIIDKNARIGPNCKIVNMESIDEANREDEGFYIRSGVVCVIRNTTIQAGVTI